MIRKIIEINKDLCNGCGACAQACHEGAIGMKDGKAVLLRDDYCDGLGDCLPACPTGAIRFVHRQALPYDEAAVMQAKKEKEAACDCTKKKGCTCPGEKTQKMKTAPDTAPASRPSCLGQWPVQIRLVPVNAPFFDGADLLIAADCTAYAYGNFHEKFMKDKVTLIGCPKLDDADYTQKLTEIFKSHPIKSVTLTRMTVPCCGGLQRAVQTAMRSAKLDVPLTVATIGPDATLMIEEL